MSHLNSRRRRESTSSDVSFQTAAGSSSPVAKSRKRDRSPDRHCDPPNKHRRQTTSTQDTRRYHPRSQPSNHAADLDPETRLICRRLPSHRITETQLEDHFSRYGEVLEVVIKPTYSFVQFTNADTCLAAVRGENGRRCHGNTLYLEVCRNRPGGIDRRRRDNDDNNERLVHVQHRESKKNRHRHEHPSEKEAAPIVQILATTDADRSYLNHVLQCVEDLGIDTQAVYYDPETTSKDLAVKRMIVKGVQAVIVIEPGYELKDIADLQVFERTDDTKDSNVRFDEYENVGLNDILLIVHRSLSKSNGQSSPLQESTTPSQLYAQQHQPPPIPPGVPPHQPFSLVSHQQRHPMPPSYPYQHPVPPPPPLHHAPPPPMNGLHPPTASAGIPSPFQQYPPPPMAAHGNGNGNGIIPPPQPSSGAPMHNAPPPPPPSAHANSNNLDIGALNHTIHLLQQVIQQQQSTQKSINMQEHNATLASIQQTLSSLMLSQQQQQQQQQQQPSQQGAVATPPSNVLHQMASQLSALAAAAAANGSPSSIPPQPPQPQSVDYPSFGGYPQPQQPPVSMLQHPHHGPVLTATPTYNHTSPSPSPASPHPPSHQQQYPTDSSTMIPSVNELLGKIKDLSKQVMPPSSSSSSISTRNPRRRT